jgi:prepilin-type N-terminal cleavage/methylation domain-containing protein
MKMIKRKKRTVKGMTLIECIVAILVVGIMGVVLCTTGVATKNFMMDTNHLNNKTQAEAKTGGNRDITKLNNDAANVGAAAVTPEDVTITVGTYGTVDAQRYSTAVSAQSYTADTNKRSDTHMDADLEFYTFTP